MEDKFKIKRIIISGEKSGLPYSKGLMASSIMATGLPPSQSYEVAKRIENYLRENKIYSVTIDELRKIAYNFLLTEVGKDFAEKYLKWQALVDLEKPLIILIGGTTGVGKSTIATEVAHRLGITRIVSTDAIREVMRAIFSKELMPALYESSFNAYKLLRTPLPSNMDPLIVGFGEQTSAVVVGVKAIIERAIKESLNMVIEGIHIVPGFIDFYKDYSERSIIVPLIITVEEENLHRSHFYVREMETEGFRPFEKYHRNFDSIRKLGRYISNLAKENNISIIPSHNLDTTVASVLEVIINHVFSVPEVIEKTKTVFSK